MGGKYGKYGKNNQRWNRSSNSTNSEQVLALLGRGYNNNRFKNANIRNMEKTGVIRHGR